MAKGSYIGQVHIGENYYPVGSLLYGEATYDTTNNYWKVDGDNLTQTTFTDNNLSKGVTIHIKFNASSSSSTVAKLKVGAATDKPIVQYGTTNVGANAGTSWRAGAVVSLTFDGTNWVENTGIDSNNTYSVITEANLTNTSQTTGGLITGQRFDQALTNRIDTAIDSSATDTQVASAKAVYDYVSAQTSGLTGAMHFKGAVSPLPTATNATTYNTYDSGDVILVDDKEYVYDKGENAASSSWVLLGDEGSYALKTSTTSVGSASSWNAGSVPTLGTAFTIPNITSVGSTPTLGTAFSIPNVTDEGSAPTFTVSNGTLTLTPGSAPTLGTAFSVPNVTSVGSVPTLGTAFTVPNVTAVGTTPSLTITSTTVVKP